MCKNIYLAYKSYLRPPGVLQGVVCSVHTHYTFIHVPGNIKIYLWPHLVVTVGHRLILTFMCICMMNVALDFRTRFVHPSLCPTPTKQTPATFPRVIRYPPLCTKNISQHFFWLPHRGIKFALHGSPRQIQGVHIVVH